MFRSRGHFRKLAADRSAVVALEYAFVGTACMALIMGVLQIGYCLYAKAALNYAAGVVARQLQTGGAKDNAATGPANFKTVTLCAAIKGLLDCNAVTLTLYPVQDYLNSSSTMPFNSGIPKSLMLLRLTYTMPLPTWPLLVGTPQQPMLITTAIPFVNEFTLMNVR